MWGVGRGVGAGGDPRAWLPWAATGDLITQEAERGLPDARLPPSAIVGSPGPGLGRKSDEVRPKPVRAWD